MLFFPICVISYNLGQSSKPISDFIALGDLLVDHNKCGRGEELFAHFAHLLIVAYNSLRKLIPTIHELPQTLGDQICGGFFIQSECEDSDILGR